MKLSVKSDYAVRAVFGLSRHFASGKAVSVEKLAGEQTIPSNYLVQILLELKNQGIVTSVRGKEGGYMLARPPAEISLGDVIRSMHGSIFESPALQDTAVHPTIRSAWEKLQGTLDETANNLTFKLLIDKADQQSEMYYI